MAVLGRGADVGHVADAGEGHLERPGDGRGGEGEDVDPDLEALEGVLGVDPEALLLVDHQEPQVVELHVFGQEPVGADDDVDGSAGQPGDDFLLLARGEGTG